VDDLAITCARLGGDRDAAQELLREHNIPWPEESSVSHTSEILGLQARNRELHGIVQQMRAELEQLSDLAEQREKEREEERGKNDEKEEVQVPSANYVTYLEKDVCRLKAEIRQVSERLTLASKPPTPPSRGLRGSDAAPGRGGAGDACTSSKNKQQQQQLEQLGVLTDTIAQLQRHNAKLENACKDWKKKHDLLQEKLRDEKEMVSM